MIGFTILGGFEILGLHEALEFSLFVPQLAGTIKSSFSLLFLIAMLEAFIVTPWWRAEMKSFQGSFPLHRTGPRPTQPCGSDSQTPFWAAAPQRQPKPWRQTVQAGRFRSEYDLCDPRQDAV